MFGAGWGLCIRFAPSVLRCLGFPVTVWPRPDLLQPAYSALVQEVNPASRSALRMTGHPAMLGAYNDFPDSFPEVPPFLNSAEKVRK